MSDHRDGDFKVNASAVRVLVERTGRLLLNHMADATATSALAVKPAKPNSIATQRTATWPSANVGV